MKHSYLCFSVVSVWLLISSTLASGAYAASPATGEVLRQCRQLSLDQSGFEECLLVIERESELALAGIEADWLALLEEAEPADTNGDDTDLIEPEQMRLMASQFREFRDQTCRFSVSTLDGLSASEALPACRVSMNRDRLEFLQRQIIERRTRSEHGTFYRGYLLITDDRGIFQSCEHRQDWEIRGEDSQTQAIADRYSETTTETLELVYVELRGQVLAVEDSAPVLEVGRINLLRAVTDTDCTGVVTEAVISESTDETLDETVDEDALLANIDEPAIDNPAQQATIDHYGAAGFIYGYFGEWTSTCAADAQQVCQAQAQHALSTEGDWELQVDRSNARQWRVRLVPTTGSHILGSGMQLSIDGVAITTVPVASQQLLLGQAQVLMQGDRALQLIDRMKTGGTFELSWNGPDQSTVSLIFSLNGVTLALDYFDNLGN